MTAALATGQRLDRRRATPSRDGFAARPLAGLAADEPIPQWVWCESTMLAVLAERDIAAMFAVLGELGLSQRRIAARTGQLQSEISEILAGRHVTGYDVLTRIAVGLGIPRGLLGLAYLPVTGPPRVGLDAIRLQRATACERCGPQTVVDRWTGREVRLLRLAMRHSLREFAAYLGISDRMVSKWEAGGERICPRPVNQAALDRVLARADQAIRLRFFRLLADNDVAALRQPPSTP